MVSFLCLLDSSRDKNGKRGHWIWWLRKKKAVTLKRSLSRAMGTLKSKQKAQEGTQSKKTGQTIHLKNILAPRSTNMTKLKGEKVKWNSSKVILTHACQKTKERTSIDIGKDWSAGESGGNVSSEAERRGSREKDWEYRRVHCAF